MINPSYKVKKYSNKLKQAKNLLERKKYFTHLKQHYIQTGGDLQVLNEINNIVDNLTDNISGDNGLISILNKNKEEIQSLKHEIKTKINEITELTEKIQQNEEQINRLQSGNSENVANDELNELRHKNDELQNKVEQLTNEAETHQNEKTRLEEEIERLEQINEEINKKYEELKQKHELINFEEIGNIYNNILELFRCNKKQQPKQQRGETKQQSGETGTSGNITYGDGDGEYDYNLFIEKLNESYEKIKKNISDTLKDINNINTGDDGNIKLILGRLNMFCVGRREVKQIKEYFKNIAEENKQILELKDKLDNINNSIKNEITENTGGEEEMKGNQ